MDVFSRPGEMCTTAALSAAFTSLKSWKRTHMSSRALFWRNCNVIPYLFRVISRYVTLLYLWGSVHQTLSHLDRFYQLAKFSHSPYWMRRYHHLSALVKLTLQRSPPELPLCGTTTTNSRCQYLQELYQQERFLTAENRILNSAIDGSKIYPVFSSSLSPGNVAHLVTLQLTLLWKQVEPSPETITEYLALLSSPASLPELDRLARSWTALLKTCQTEVAGPTTRTGRKTRRTVGVHPVDAGLEACQGLQPVFVRRELLKRKPDVDWTALDEYHNAPYVHSLIQLVGDDPPTEFPESWTVCSITMEKDRAVIGQRTINHEVLFERDLPFTLRTQVCLTVPT